MLDDLQRTPPQRVRERTAAERRVRSAHREISARAVDLEQTEARLTPVAADDKEALRRGGVSATGAHGRARNRERSAVCRTLGWRLLSQTLNRVSTSGASPSAVLSAAIAAITSSVICALSSGTWIRSQSGHNVVGGGAARLVREKVSRFPHRPLARLPSGTHALCSFFLRETTQRGRLIVAPSGTPPQRPSKASTRRPLLRPPRRPRPRPRQCSPRPPHTSRTVMVASLARTAAPWAPMGQARPAAATGPDARAPGPGAAPHHPERAGSFAAPVLDIPQMDDARSRCVPRWGAGPHRASHAPMRAAGSRWRTDRRCGSVR
jgi:hypothetical protein